MAAICGVVARSGGSAKLDDIIEWQQTLGRIHTRREANSFNLALQGEADRPDCVLTTQTPHLILALHCRRAGATQFLERLIKSWERDGDAALDAVRVDFALSLWDSRMSQLYLARAPLSSFGLAYREGGGDILFSTVAAALGRGSTPDLDWLATQQGGGAVFGARRTAFSEVRLVEPGTVVRIASGDVTIRRFWHARQIEGATREEASERLRAALGEAVSDALREIDAPVAAHLSAGRDSGAVAATAALELDRYKSSLLALTSVPNPRVRLPQGAFCADEGAGAAAVCLMHPNIEHRRVVTTRFALGAKLDQVNRLLPGPHGMPVNLPWWSTIHQAARAEGASIVLTGAAGNLTVSAGGPWAIVDLLASGDITGWLSAITAARRMPDSSWKNLLASSFVPFVPRAVLRLAQRSTGRLPRKRGRYLAGALRERVSSNGPDKDQQPLRDWSAARRSALEQWDGADPSNEPVHGVTLRDPTADIRVVEASLAIGLRDLASPYDRRPVFEEAFSDRLPSSTLHPRFRGLQAADWPAAIDPIELSEYFETLMNSRSVGELVDINAIRQSLYDWPDGPVDVERAAIYADELLPAIALASFAHIHWPG